MTKALDYYVSRGLTLSMHLEAWETKAKVFRLWADRITNGSSPTLCRTLTKRHSSASVDLI